MHQKNPDQLSGFDKYHSLPQIRFIPDFNATLFGQGLKSERRCGFIGRFENLEVDFKRLCSLLQIDTHTLPRFMMSPEKESEAQEKNYGMYYDAELIKIVREIYREDFQRLGYSHYFEGIQQTLQLRERSVIRSKLILGNLRKDLRRFERRVRTWFRLL